MTIAWDAIQNQYAALAADHLSRAQALECWTSIARPRYSNKYFTKTSIGSL